MTEAKKTTEAPADVTAPVAPFATDAGILAALSPEARAAYKAEVEDYSQYVAVAPIHHLGELAYIEGGAVPASNVKRWKYDEMGLVAKRGTKAADEAIRRATPVTPSTIRAPGDD